MAVSVASYTEGLLVRDLLRQDIQPQRTGLNDARSRPELRSRIKALVGFWEELRNFHAPQHKHTGYGNGSIPQSVIKTRDGATRELFRPYGTARPEPGPPPTYEESIHDVPPDYTTSDALATAQIGNDAKISRNGNAYVDLKLPYHGHELHELHMDVDISELEGIRSFANKKAKKAAKQAQMSKWADSDNEEGKDGTVDGGEGGDGNGGGDGGAGASGDGGEDGDDWWAEAGSKKKDKKKKKKNAWEEFEEEEEKRQEEEAKKAEEEAAAAATNGAGEADPMDEWGSFATAGKKKKGKNGKNEPEPPPPPPPPEPEPHIEPVYLGASATADANPDEWGSFATVGKKKKGTKKGKVCDLLFFRMLSRFFQQSHATSDRLLSSDVVLTGACDTTLLHSRWSKKIMFRGFTCKYQAPRIA